VDPAVNALAVDRAGLRVSHRDKEKYETLVNLVREHSPPGGWIYATPDCPEVYFLAERKNPTRAMFEFFDVRDGHTERQLELISRHSISVVVLNLRPGFSEKISPEFMSALSRDFPHAVQIDNFVVAYRDVGNL